LRPPHAVDTFLLFQVLVCLIDFIYPPKPIPVETRTEPKLEKEKGEEENHGKQASGDELVRIITVFLCSSFVIPCFLTVHKGTDIWISDFEEYSDLGRTILSYNSLAPASVRSFGIREVIVLDF